MTNLKPLGLAFLMVVVNGLIGHFSKLLATSSPPTSTQKRHHPFISLLLAAANRHVKRI